MWMEKLSRGVLRVLTPLGPRYIEPGFWQRLYLLWLFRNFQVLPMQVLSLRQRQWIDSLCALHGFVSLPMGDAWGDAPILGTLERRPPVEVEALPQRRPSGRVAEVAPVAVDLGQQG